MALPFLYPLALLALASVIPLIILYMLLPKPLRLDVPSVMFLMKIEESRKKIYTSITKLVKDPLFLVQLLVLIMLALAAAGPYITARSPLSDADTVIIIDASASMEAGGRMDKVLKDVPKYLSLTNSIILAESEPVTVAEKVTASDAKEALSGIRPKAVTADISAAMSKAASLLSEKGGNVVVFSDFTSYDGLDPLVAKKMFDSGLNVVFVNGYAAPAGNNVGIVNGYTEILDGKYNYRFVVRNYGPAVTIPVKTITTYENGTAGASRSMMITIGENNSSQFLFENISCGTTEVRLETNDALAMDNSAWISVPASKNARALFVTDSTRKLPSQIALSLIADLTLDNASSVPADASGYDFVVVDMNRPLTDAESAALNGYAQNGGDVVFVAGNYLTAANMTVDLAKMLPLKTGEIVTNDRGAAVYQFRNTTVTGGLDLSDIYIRKYLSTDKRISDVDIPVQTAGSSALFAYAAYGAGTVIYVGFNDIETEDEWNNFASSPAFAVFWNRLGIWIADIGTVNEYNVAAGTKSTMPSELTVTSPNGNITTNVVYYDTAGIWTVDGNRIAVNLYNDKESNTHIDGTAVVDAAASDKSIFSEQYEVKKELYYYLILAAFLFIAAELIILKKRDEL